VGDGTPERLEQLVNQALDFLRSTYAELDDDTSPGNTSGQRLTTVKLSDDLQRWRESQHRLARILPEKGYGLSPASPEVLKLLGAERWPQIMLTNSALFGSGWANLLMGAYDPESLFSNYVLDLVFYYEHGYHKVFPDFESVIHHSFTDKHALQTHGGWQRRKFAEIGQRYIRAKVEQEELFKQRLTNKSACMNRTEAYTISIAESSILGIAGEAIPRGFDVAGTFHDLVFASPGTDVVDVGSDIYNSEILNSFLNTRDIAETGVVTEDALRRVYDAFAHTGARTYTERWSEPAARMCACLYTWHLTNDRHRFLRRAILGWPKARKPAPPIAQREADWDEVFDTSFHTTGLSRPLANPCDGHDPCDHVQESLAVAHKSHGPSHAELLTRLWWYLSIGPVQYARSQEVDLAREDDMMELLRLTMAQVYSVGLVDEMAWLMAHANHHAWQINYLYEAAMFGSLLDRGGMSGKLDRVETEVEAVRERGQENGVGSELHLGPMPLADLRG
jgi:hypothetical protein